MLLNSPLEQFEILSLRNNDFFLVFWKMSYNLMYFYFLLIILLLLSLLYICIYYITFIPSVSQIILEFLYKFVFNVFKQQIGGSKGQCYFPLIFFSFLVVLLSNLIGLVPLGFTVTSHLVLTFSLAFSFNLAFIFLGFKYQYLNFLNIFSPQGVPFYILPLVVFLEMVSYFLRSISMSVRLFANMLAGHILLHILILGVVLVINSFFLIKIFFFIPVIFLVFLIYFLEIGVSLIQGYIILALLCIYIKDSIIGASH